MKIIRRPWSAEEDSDLLQLITKYGASGSWPSIAKCVDTRTGKQCRERYINHLDPTVKKTPWTREEDAIIRETYEQLGSQWKKFMPLLPGRADNMIKNRYHVISRYAPNPPRKFPFPIQLPMLLPTDLPTQVSVDCTPQSTRKRSISDTSAKASTIDDAQAKKLDLLLSARNYLDSKIQEMEAEITSSCPAAPYNIIPQDSDADHPVVPVAPLIPSRGLDADSFDAFEFDWGELNLPLAAHDQIFKQSIDA